MGRQLRVRGRFKLSVEQVELIRQRYVDGETQADLAEGFGVSVNTVGRVLNRRGPYRHIDVGPSRDQIQEAVRAHSGRSQISVADAHLARKMYADGSTIEDVANKLDVSYTTARAVIAGIAPYNIGDNPQPVRSSAGRSKRKLEPKQVKNACKWYEDGVSMSDIAERLGVSPSTARCAIRGVGAYRSDDD